MDRPESRPVIAEVWNAFHDGKKVGRVTNAVWSPRLEKNIRYVWVPIDLAEAGNELEIVTDDGEKFAGQTTAIPFIDPQKEVPAADLRQVS